jgi:flagellar motility protein MotE (MotC chaperone)
MTEMPKNYENTLDFCESLIKIIFEETIALEESTEYKLKEVQALTAHLKNIENMKWIHDRHQ